MIQALRSGNQNILMIGSHKGIIQSILDYDFLLGKEKPSLCAILSTGRKYEKFYFGKKEILLPVFESIASLPQSFQEKITVAINVRSGRRVLHSSKDALSLPKLKVLTIFAEDVPERQALELLTMTKDKLILGPASIGLLLPGFLKSGAIGGTDAVQFLDGDLLDGGSVAVISASGGMTNELMRIVTTSGKRISFGLHMGGDRFPLTSPKDAFLLAENDSQTTHIVYYGELGGVDEYEIATLYEQKKLTKPTVCYIAGIVSDLFPTPPQFGHAKAMAGTVDESAKAKRARLKEVGMSVATSFEEFVSLVGQIPSLSKHTEKSYTTHMDEIKNRSQSLITTSLSQEKDGEAYFLNSSLLSLVENNSFAYLVASAFLGKQIKSKETEKVVEFILKLLIDHGPHVSGAVNTIVTARAGRDLVSALASGLLTIGSRFGGAVNEAAGNWLKGVSEKTQASEFVESFASRNEYILGIGHKKYRVDLPDPRVKKLLTFIESCEKKVYTSFALEVEKVTSSKKGNLILNIDGAIAAVLLDVLSEKEGISPEELQELVTQEFFNSLFVLSRSVGFIAHFLDQKRLDEGLLRLPDHLVSSVSMETES